MRNKRWSWGNVICVLLIAAVGVMIWLNVKQAQEPVGWDVCYKFTNQNIKWEGAGYNGIWAR